MSHDPTSPSYAIASEHRISDLATLKVFVDPMRSRIMRAISDTPRSVQDIAKELDVPFTRLYYHIKMLERHHLIQHVTSRTLSGAVEEKYYCVVAHTFVIDRHLLTPTTLQEDIETVETLMDQVLDSSRSDIRFGLSDGLLDPTAQPPSAKALFIQRRINQMTEEQLSVFYDRIIDLLEEFSKPQDINGHSSLPYALGIIFHPTQSQQND